MLFTGDIWNETRGVHHRESMLDSADAFPSSHSGHGSTQAGNAAAPKYVVDVISDLAGFDALEKEWTAFDNDSRNCATAFQSFSFCRTIARSMLRENREAELHVVSLRNHGGALILIAPMIAFRRGGIVMAEWLGEPVVQYGDIAGLMSPDDDAMDAMLSASSPLGTPEIFDFRKIREDASIAQWLARNGHPTGVTGEGPYIDFTKIGSAVPAFRSSKKKKDRRRKLRKLEQRGEVTFEVAAGSARAAELMALSLDMKLKWLEDKGLISRALSQKWVRDSLIDMARSSPDTVVTALMVDDGAAAIDVGFRYAGGYYAFLGVMDHKYGDSSPGDLLINNTIEWNAENGVTRYDFLPPDQPYKQSWSNASVKTANFVVARSWRGWAYARIYLGICEPLLKSAFHGAPDPVRRLLGAAFNWARR